MKKCSKCGEEYLATLEYFSARKRNKCGLHEQCRTCRSNRDKEYRAANKDHYTEISKQWKTENKEHIDEVDKKYREDHKDRKSETNKQWHEKNKERKNEMVKQWALNNKERRMETIKRWQDNHKENVANSIKRYKINNRDRYAIYEQRRKSIKRALPATLTLDQWRNIKDYFDNRYAYCGEEVSLTQDHLIAVVHGGSYTADNIIPACVRCNCSKNSMPFNKWYLSQIFYSKIREHKILKYQSCTIENEEKALEI